MMIGRSTPRALALIGLVLLFLASPARQASAQASRLVNVILPTPGGKVEVNLPDEKMNLTRQQLLDWVNASVRAVSAYYGHFPVPRLTLEIHAGRGSGIRHGVTYPRGGGLIHVTVGTEAGVADLKDDWVLIHEMIHLAFPSMADNHHWIEEGISTYVEPVARAQSRLLSADEVWREFIRDMPKGEPGSDDHGLDNTPTWGRTYWGGALFCLVADVRIREQTHNRKGLRDALRAIMNHGGVISEDWDIEQALAIGDKGTGTRVLQSLYNEVRAQPAPVNLDRLWQKLGISLENGRTKYNDGAPDAMIRKAILSR